MDWRETILRERRAAIDAERARDLAYKARRKPGMPPAPSRSIRTELDWLEQVGGPLTIDALPPPMTVRFNLACTVFGEMPVLEILMGYTTDVTLARRLWPWIAQILHWHEAASEFSDPSKDLTPKEVADILASVRRVSGQLDDLLETLHQSWTILRDGAPHKNGHLEYLHQMLVQGASGVAAAEVDINVDAMMTHFDRYRDFRYRLDTLGKSAASAQGALDKRLLTSTNRFQSPGVQSFVQRLGVVWKVLTGKAPKAYKVLTRDPPISTFVRFVQQVSGLSQKVTIPQLKTVAAALKAPPFDE